MPPPIHPRNQLVTGPWPMVSRTLLKLSVRRYRWVRGDLSLFTRTGQSRRVGTHLTYIVRFKALLALPLPDRCAAPLRAVARSAELLEHRPGPRRPGRTTEPTRRSQTLQVDERCCLRKFGSFFVLGFQSRKGPSNWSFVNQMFKDVQRICRGVRTLGTWKPHQAAVQRSCKGVGSNSSCALACLKDVLFFHLETPLNTNHDTLYRFAVASLQSSSQGKSKEDHALEKSWFCRQE